MSYSKYKVNTSEKARKQRTVYDKHTDQTIQFDSAVQKKFYDEYLIPLFRKGQIIDYELQKPYELLPAFDRKNGKHVRKIEYLADFWIQYKDGRVEVRDVKGSGYLVDDVAKIKRKLMYYHYPNLDYQWVCYCRGKWVDWDWYMAERRAAKREKINQKG